MGQRHHRAAHGTISENDRDSIDDIARGLADGGECERAWFLRGVADALAGDSPDADRDALYLDSYRRGYNAALAEG